MRISLFLALASFATCVGAGVFPLNPELPYTVGVDSNGENAFVGTIADLTFALGDQVFHQGPAKAGEHFARKPTNADVEKPLRFSCRFTTKDAAKSQRLVDNAHAGTGDGILIDVYQGRLRLAAGYRHTNFSHPHPVPSGREVAVAVEINARGEVAMSVDGDRRVCAYYVDGRLLPVPAGFNHSEPDTLLSLDAPIKLWDDALPLGNGRAGALVWGEGNTLRLTLDRSDYWHNTICESFTNANFNIRTLADCVRKNDNRRRTTVFDNRTDEPTKLPGVRLTLTLGKNQTLRHFRLDRSNGAAHVTVATPAGEREILCWFDDESDYLSLRLPPDVTIVKKEFNRNPSFAKLGGYPAPKITLNEQGAFYWRGKRKGATSRFDHDFKAGVRFVGANAAPNSTFWKRFNRASAISIPDVGMQRLYEMMIYFYGAAGRRGCAPMALQGLWTADNNMLPPWNGDYHNDMNTEMTHWAAGPAGCIEALEGFADFYLDRIESYRAFGRKIFESKDGAVVTPTMGYSGEMIAGWTAYSVLPEHGIWAFNTFVDAFDYAPTRDKAARYLAFGRELAAALEHGFQLKDGVRTLTLSCSPEVDDNRLSAFYITNTSYTRSILNAFYLRLSRMAEYIGEKDEAAKWKAYVGSFGPVSVKDGVLEIAKGRLLDFSHRHASHLMDLFPFYDTPRDAEVNPVKSVDQFESLTTAYWVGFSFSWEGCLNARLGRGERAWKYLKEFQTGFTSRNGFNVNGDQLKCGLSRLTYRPFTLDANLGYARGIQEMLLQYDPHANVVKLFPALPKRWDGEAVSFRDLRVPGGHSISATRAADGKITYTLKPYPGSKVPQVRF